MSTTRTNITTSSTWQEWLAARSRRLNLFIRGAPIRYQLGAGNPPAYLGAENLLPAGQYSLDRVFDAVRVKSDRLGAPAIVDVEAISAEEIPGA